MTTSSALEEIEDDYHRLASEQALVSEQLVTDLGITAGSHVLDIGCGSGLAAVAAARRRAKVTGLDVDEKLLERARQRAEAESVADDVEFVAADGRQLPFPDASFDVVLSTFAAVFFPDQHAAAAEMARVLKPGGLIALTAYTEQGIPGLLFDFGHEVMNMPMPEYPHYAWGRGPRAQQLLGSHFFNVRVKHKAFDTCFASAQGFTDFVALWNPNMRKLLGSVSQDIKTRWFDGARTLLEPFNRSTDGTFLADMGYAVITGVRNH